MSDSSKYTLRDTPVHGRGDFKKGRSIRLEERRADEDSLPTSKMARYGWRDCYRSDNRPKIERFLQSRLGRDWNEVASELTKTYGLRPDDWKVERAVHQKVLRDSGGFFYTNGKCGPENVQPGEFYVDPDTGVLCKAPGQRPSYKMRRAAAFDNADRRKDPINNSLQYHRLNGIWYAVKVRPMEICEIKATQVKDIYFKNSGWPDSMANVSAMMSWVAPTEYWSSSYSICQYYFGGMVPVTRRQLNKKEIKRLGLNAPIS